MYPTSFDAKVSDYNAGNGYISQTLIIAANDIISLGREMQAYQVCHVGL